MFARSLNGRFHSVQRFPFDPVLLQFPNNFIFSESAFKRFHCSSSKRAIRSTLVCNPCPSTKETLLSLNSFFSPVCLLRNFSKSKKENTKKKVKDKSKWIPNNLESLDNKESEKLKEGIPVVLKEKETLGTNVELQQTINSIENSFGKGTVLRLGDAVKDGSTIGVISTGSISLDIALGIGGLPRGRIVEIFGPESSGKTTLALHVIAEAHKLGGKCVFIDAEHSLDPKWARKLGVKVDELLVCQPDNGEQALDIADMLVQEGNIDVVVIDSVAALVTKAELDGHMGDHHIGSQARLMSQGLRKLTGSIGKSRTSKTILVFINQIRHKIGVMFGSPETTSGGTALKYYSSARLDIRRVTSIKNGEQVIGNQIKVKVIKNKLAPPYREAIFDIDFGKGISKNGELVDLGVKSKVLEKTGAWYSFKGEKIAQGREKAKFYFDQNPAVAAEIEADIRRKLLCEEEIGEFLGGIEDTGNKEVAEE